MSNATDLSPIFAEWKAHTSEAAKHNNAAKACKIRALWVVVSIAVEALGGKGDVKRTTGFVTHDRGRVRLNLERTGAIYISGDWDRKLISLISDLEYSFRWATVDTIADRMRALLALEIES